jgi:hypothetical protein
MTKTYTVSTVREQDGRVTTAPVGAFRDIRKAFAAARRAAHTRKDCVNYGPTAVAFVGREITAVVIWQ